MLYAEVAVDYNVRMTFHYHVPEHLVQQIQVGHLVRVSFRTGMQPAIVVELDYELPPDLADITTKPIIELLDPQPVLTVTQVDLGLWLAEEYLAPPGACLWLMLPPGLTGSSKRRVTLLAADTAPDTPMQTAIVEALRDAPQQTLPLDDLSNVTGYATAARAARDLANAGIVQITAHLTPSRATPKTVRTVQRNIPADEVDAALENFGRAWKQQKVFAYIAQVEYPLDVPEVYDATDATSADLNNLEAKGLVTQGERLAYRDSLADKDFVPSHAPPLTDAQQRVWERIRPAVRGMSSTDNQHTAPTPTSKIPNADPSLTLPASREGTAMNAPLSSSSANESSDSGDREHDMPLSDANIEEKKQNAPTPSPSPTHWGGEPTESTRGQKPESKAASTDDTSENTPALDSDTRVNANTAQVPSPSQWGGDLGEGASDDTYLAVTQQGWAAAYAPISLYRRLKHFAREMRQQMTPPEKMLWQHLRRKQRRGYKFRRQHRMQVFILDFYAPDARLAVEVDGAHHAQQTEYDAMRDRWLAAVGVRVLRIAAERIENDLEAVLTEIDDALTSTAPTQNRRFLLHGVTGSGKTEIYLRAIDETLQQGRQAIFLVPEIALTPQTIRRVARRFPDQVAVVHGSLSRGERYDTWQRARQGEIGVIVGTRSALFTPLPDVGLVILDEEHDHSYKQSPPIQPPYYHARRAADEMMRVNRGVLILGSATPAIETYHRAQNDDLIYLHLPDRIMGHRKRLTEQAQRQGVTTRYQPLSDDAMTIELPPVSVVDMRDELKAGNRSMFSRALQTSLTDVLERGEKAMLLLNRRGQSTYVFCRDCGYVVECDNCDTPMTYHRHGEAMRCHHCNFQKPAPQTCPACGGERIKFFGAGTQQVEAAIRKAFPQARTVRWDADTASRSELHEEILQTFAGGDANVLIGTQMIAKGLDLPLVTLVGVVSADPGLALPDFRANERAFQLLTQVAGRAGRGVLGGEVIVQTYQPQHPSIQAAADHDYATFYAGEIDARRNLGYPPFRRLGRVLIQNQHPIEAQRHAEEAAAKIRQFITDKDLTATQLIGPAPCFFSRLNTHYRWQVLVRSTNPLHALEDLQLRSGWYVDIDPLDIL